MHTIDIEEMCTFLGIHSAKWFQYAEIRAYHDQNEFQKKYTTPLLYYYRENVDFLWNSFYKVVELGKWNGIKPS
jgi:hypothetical protein